MSLQVVVCGDDGTVLQGSLKLPAATTIGGSSVSALGNITATSATAFDVGRQGATNPALNIDTSASAGVTGWNVIAGNLAAGAALAIISTGTDESGTIDAKGAGTLTINGTATGATIIPKGRVTPEFTTIAGDGAVTLNSGTVYLTKGSAAAITVAAPGAGGIGKRITITTGTDFAHVVTFTGTTLLDGTTGANSTWTAAAFAGSSITFIGVTATRWTVESFNLGTIAP